MSAFLSVSRRVRAMISERASSTTLRVLEKGALNTAIPLPAAAARSIWFVPMQKAPTPSSSGAACSTCAVSWVFDRMPSTATPCTRSSSSDSLSARSSRWTSNPASRNAKAASS